MKLHDLHPVPGSRRERTRVGRGIAAGKGKTAGRGTKGQKSRTGSSIPAWFEGGQTPIHMRVPKLRGFKNRFRTEYAVVNVGRIEAALAGGRLEPGPRGAPATVNAELLFAAGVIGRLSLPLKILGAGDLDHPVLAIADAFSGEAKRKIEAAGGTAMVLEAPTAAPRRGTAAAPAALPRETAAEPETPAPASPEAEATQQAEPAEAAGVAQPPEAGEASEDIERVKRKPARRSRAATAAEEPQVPTEAVVGAASGDEPAAPTPKPAPKRARPARKTQEPPETPA
jgi:large subunit ribosomal protein L15